jgi:hypothetical protein
MIHCESYVYESGQSWGLMVGPVVIPDLFLELPVVVEPVADVDDEVVPPVLRVEVLGHIVDIIAVYLLEPSAGRKGHRYDSLADVGEVKVLTFVFHELFGPRHHFPHEVKHTE